MTSNTIPDFVQRLIDAGWTREEAEAEWERIQADDEDGYDGPPFPAED